MKKIGCRLLFVFWLLFDVYGLLTKLCLIGLRPKKLGETSLSVIATLPHEQKLLAKCVWEATIGRMERCVLMALDDAKESG